MFRKLSIVIILSGGFILSTASAQENSEINEKTPTDSTDIGEYYIAYYFHGDKRCITCKKFEAFSQEALESGFEKELEDSLIIWLPVNYDVEENSHFIKDYSLYTKALILSEVVQGKEVKWKNLDKIWQLVGDKEKFINYVKAETKSFMQATDK
jgi:hypothetical protein